MWQDTNPYKQQLDIKERSEIKQSDKKHFPLLVIAFMRVLTIMSSIEFFVPAYSSTT